MAVYVDPAVWPFGNMVMCHCWADSDGELLAMMDRIGVQRKWIQGHPELSFGKHRNASWIHFVISKSKRALAVRYGAIETDRYGPLEWEAYRVLSGAVPSDEAARERATRKLLAVASCRGVHGFDL